MNDVTNYFDHPAVSSSKLKLLLESPQRYYHRYIACDLDDKPSAAMRLGSAFHTYFLEGEDAFNRDYAVIDASTRTTKKYKEEHAIIEAEGRNSILLHEYQPFNEMKAALNKNPFIRELFSDGLVEHELYWTDEVTGVDCKSKLDFINTKKKIIVDLKTAVDASEEGFTKAAGNNKYYMQAAMYLEACKQNNIDIKAFVFVAIETTFPYISLSFTPDDEFIEKGYEEIRRGISLYKECKDNDSWFGYSSKPLVQLSLPRWMRGAA